MPNQKRLRVIAADIEDAVLTARRGQPLTERQTTALSTAAEDLLDEDTGNAGCDSCGENDRMDGSKLCEWCALDALANALKVLVLDPKTRAWLEANDPMGLGQAEEALEEVDEQHNDQRSLPWAQAKTATRPQG